MNQKLEDVESLFECEGTMNRREALKYLAESDENRMKEVTGTVYKIDIGGRLVYQNATTSEWEPSGGLVYKDGYEKVLKKPKPFEEIDAFVPTTWITNSKEQWVEKICKLARLTVDEALRQMKEQQK